MSMPTRFSALVALCEKLESTTKRKIMVSWVASFVVQLETQETEPAISMLMGRVFPKWDQRVLEISWNTLSAIIHQISDVDDEAFARAFGKTGDVGDAVRTVFEERKVRKQTTLIQKDLTVLEVRHTFETVSGITGVGSRDRKERLLETLLSSASPLEAKYLVKIMIGEMRTGFHEGLMEVAVAEAFNTPLEVVQTASMFTGDIGQVARIAKVEGEQGLRKLGFTMFRPIKPMLAQMAASVAEALEEHEGRTSFEHKLDGARIQIHKSSGVVRIFSRRLTEVTESLPDIVELVLNEVNAREAILEGEVVAVGKDGTPMPFQHVMRRFRRVQEVKQAVEEIPVRLYLFDALYVDGQSLINRAYLKRRKRLSEVAGRITLSEQIVTGSVQAAEQFLQMAIQAGHEGLMAKKPDSPYTPGVRGKRWFKIKVILEPLDLVIVAAEYGYGRRHGWLSDYYLAARDPQSNNLSTVGKTFKGLTDTEIIDLTQRLKQLAISKQGNKVLVKPKVVVEVAYNEIQKSPKYECGMALRFARITRIRDDKAPEEADSIQKVREIYQRQFKKKARR
jgi:DNA ligase-1